MATNDMNDTDVGAGLICVCDFRRRQPKFRVCGGCRALVELNGDDTVNGPPGSGPEREE